MESKSNSKKYREFAIAFYKVAKYDLTQAENALESKAYPDAVFHSQQAVEKIIKAALELEEFFVSDHDVSKYFLEIIIEKSSKKWRSRLFEVLALLEWFKGKWQTTRYPRLINGKVVSPVDIHTKEVAEEALNKAHKVFDIITKFIQDKHKIKL